MMDRTGAVAADNDVARQHYKPSVRPAARSRRDLTLLIAAAGLLVLVRVPSLVQPMGADQGLYAYVGERILLGERPYVDAWDQKPPAIHYTYAVMRALWPSDGAVAAADLAAAAAIAVLLFSIGRTLATTGVGSAAALLFLFLSNPAFTRLAGVRVRAQCETFIALLVTAAICLVIRRRDSSARAPLAAGILIGLACAFKYNAVVYVAAAGAAGLLAGTATARQAAAFAAGLGAAPGLFLLLLAGAWRPLYDATVGYNVQYSGETYTGSLHFAAYLLGFPVERARDDALWTLGCAGCAVLLLSAVRGRERLVPVVWVAAACLSIAINGSRGLPQYFVQAAPALALAAACAGGILVAAARRAPSPAAARLALAAGIVVVSVAVWRVNQFPKLLEQTVFDAQRMAGRLPRDVHLERYADERKYSAAGAEQIARFMREASAPHQTVFLFGFAGAAYVYADRASASRFFWSRPVIAGFKSGEAGYGPAGLLADLERARPSVVALQIRDWAPDVDDSAHFFLNEPGLSAWLHGNYRHATGPEGFDVWLRRE